MFRLVVCKILEFPSRKADLIYHLCQGYELAKMGVVAVYWLRPVEPLTSGRIAELLSEFGVRPHPNFDLRILHFKNKPLAGLEFRIRLGLELWRSEKKVIFVPSHLRTAVYLVRTRKWFPFRHPLVYEIHNLDHIIEQDRGIGRYDKTQKEEQWVYSQVDGLVAISSPIVDLLHQLSFNPCSRIIVLPQGVRSDFLKDSDPSGESSPSLRKDQPVMITYCGSLYSYKGVGMLLESLCHLPARVHLNIIGGNPPEALEELRGKARQLEINQRVHFWGSVPHNMVANHLLRADILALPLAEDRRSMYFTSPVKLFEYLLVGRPLVVTNFPTTRAILDNQEACVFPQKNDPKGFAQAVQWIIDNPEVAKKMAQKAREVGESYTWEIRAEKLREFCESILNKD